VAVFVDVANIFYAAKAAGVDIDYVTLLKAASAGRDLVRAYAYTGLDPDNENQRNFHEFLRRSNYKVVSKDIRKYGDGKVKANLDIELVVDMMKTARNLDIAIVVSGDGDFAPAIRAVQEQGVRVEVISFRGNTSSDLIEVADQFTDIVQLARVEKGTRSGRRVADDDADLSMTEVPDKQTDGTGVGRGRARGRGRGREAEPVAATSRSRGRIRTDAAEPIGAAAANGAGLVALPGERLSRAAGPLNEADLARAEVFTLDELDDAATDAAAAAEGGSERIEDGEEPRRRRRRGGRGRGRGRGRGEETGIEETAEGEAAEAEPAPAIAAAPRATTPRRAAADTGEDEDEDVAIAPAPRGPRTTPFGSVWDSQLGTPTASTGVPRAPLVDEEDFEEPEIPEYLIAEQRRGANRGGAGPNRGGARGGRSAYQSAMDRERYGRGSGGGGGINRYPDVSGRSRPSTPPRDDRNYSRGARPSQAPAPAPRSSSEPWSDVPPELEALLRAQVAQKPTPRSGAAPARASEVSEADVTEWSPTLGAPQPAAKAAAKPRATRKPAATKATGTKAAAKPRATRKVAAADATSGHAGPVARTAEAGAGEPAATAKAPGKPRATRVAAAAKASAASAADGADTGDGAVAAPKRRATRKTTPAEPI
ncbi:MAG: NYN domain-containing protein, partial [Chloroflexota bacterium]